MASSINASTTGAGGVITTADNSGILNLQSGGVTVATVQSTGFSLPTASTINAANTFGFKNRIINGDMRIDQRNAGASVTPASGAYTLDRWDYLATQASKFTIQQNAGAVTPPTGFTNYLGMTVASAVSVGSGDTFYLKQPIEGLNISDLAWGTANAKTVTLSFQVYSSLTGTFGGALFNSAGNRSYPFSYTVSSANTWTAISVTIAGDTTGTWLTTNGIGINVIFGLGSGSTFTATSGAWAAGTYVQPNSTVSVVGTASATLYITGVQLEVGSQATSFDFRDYGRELILCQRYFEMNYNQGVKPGSVANAGTFYNLSASDISGSAGPIMQFKVSKRTTPTMTAYTQAGASGWAYITPVGSGTAAINVQFMGENGGLLYINTAVSSLTAQTIGYWTASAEL